MLVSTKMAGIETTRRRNVFVDNGFMFIFDAFVHTGKNVSGDVEKETYVNLESTHI